MFPSVLKYANITPVLNEGYRGSEETYHPVSILPVISKIFVKMQPNYTFHGSVSKYLCGFQKGFSARHCLLAIFEK